MNKPLLDEKALKRIALGLSAQSGLSIGVYDAKGTPILENEAFLSSDIINAISKLGPVGVINVFDLSGKDSRQSAVALRDKQGRLLGIFMVSADPTDTVLFDKHLSLIETVLSLYLSEREESILLLEEKEDREKKGTDLSKELLKNETVTEIIGKMESEEDFDKVSCEILALCGEFLNLSDAFILQIDKDADTAVLVAQWHDPNKQSLTSRFEGIALSSIPFADGLSYTISSDSRMPETFKEFLRGYDITAGIFLPIFLDDINVMYLCATMEQSPRHWSLAEAGFLSDVRRVITTILSKRIAKNSLASSFAVVESVLENIGCGVLVMEQKEGKVLYTNDTFHAMFSDPSDKQRFERRIRQTPEKMEQIREYFLENKKRYVSVALGRIRWVDDSQVRLATVFDITENKEFETRIEKQANLDVLTGIYNRNFFIKELGNLLISVHNPGAFLCMNVDGFKDINVTSGNDGGDLLLSSISKFLLKLSGDNARVYRLGSDEFAILIKDSKKLDPMEVAQSILKRFKAPWQLSYKDCYLTTSIGIGRFPKDGDDVSSVIKAADIALSKAKKKGPGSILFFDQEMEKEHRKGILLKSFLSDAVENNCNGMEILKQEATFEINGESFLGSVGEYIWNAPEMGTKSTQEFMPVARKILLQDKIVKKLILDLANETRDKNDFGYPGYTTGVLIDILEFVSCDVLEYTKEALSQSGVNPARLVLTIAGRAHSKDVSVIKEKIKAIKALGVHVACAGTLDLYSFDNADFDATLGSPGETA